MDGFYELYRAMHPDGSTRDFLIGESPDGPGHVVILEGNTGASLHATLRPVPGGDPDECAKMIRAEVEERQAANYAYVGRAKVVSRRVQSVASQTDQADTDLNWELKASNVVDVKRLFSEIANVLGDQPLPGHRVTLSPSGLIIQYGIRNWVFGFDPNPDGFISPQTGKGGGIVRSHHGALPILILATFADRFRGSVTAADNNGETLSMNYADLAERIEQSITSEQADQLAARLGLCVPSLSSFSIKSDLKGFWA